MNRTSPTVGTWWRLAGIAVVVVVAVLAGASTASAHTEFESSTPADGDTVTGPLAAVVLVFTNPAEESGDGFELLMPDGTVRTPTEVRSADGTTFEARFAPALDVGTYGFRWEVQAGDAHPIDGAFRFVVESGSPPTTEADTDPGATTTVSAPTASDDADEALDEPAPVAADGDATVALEDFLAGDAAPEPFAGRVGRTLSIAGSVFAIGVLAALWWVIRGPEAELVGLLRWTQLAGVALLAGGVIELGALDEAQGVPLGDLLTSKPGLATLLDMAAGILVIVGFSSGRGTVRGDGGAALRWMPTGVAVVGVLGVALAIVSYSFDGHTISRGAWAVHAAVNVVHVTAAGVWAGGVFALTLVVVRRRRAGRAGGLVELVVRFSSIAAVTLGALVVAGVALTWLVIDGPGELFSSSWGRVLLAKVTAVTVAASLGAYNHLKLRPALEAHPDDDVLGAHLRSSLLIESAVLAVVIVLTAVLVAAST